MPRIITQAMKITKKTWSICAKALPPKFAMTPPEKVYGRYCIINKQKREEIKPKVFTVTTSNVWVSAQDFERDFRFIGSEVEGSFVEVERI